MAKTESSWNNMEQPLISILTPFKNTAQFLPECIESVINQSYPHWEMILINDHSNDDSLVNAIEYARKDVRIKVMENEGSGIIPALRTAFKYSHGEMITRMDSDDIMTSNKLEVLSNLLIGKGKGNIAVGQVKYFAETGINDGYYRYEKWLNSLTSQGNNYTEIYKECVIPSPNFLIYKDDLIECGDFQSGIYPEDYDLAFRFYKHGIRCIPCDRLTHHWRDYSTRTSRTHEHYNNNYFLDIKLRYFLELEHDDTRPLIIWGAGTKGKFIAKYLSDRSIAFQWICDNPKKIGHKIYGQELLPFEHLSQFEHPQSIVTVANEQAQAEIKIYMQKHGMRPMRDYFFFC